MITSEPLVEASVQSSEIKSERCCFALTRPGERRTVGQKQNLQLRNEAPLNFVSLRSSLHYGGSSGLSRVEMNAQKTGALDSPPDPERICVSNFSLDKADGFIDGEIRRGC
jgi:hypothetical protein